MGFKRAIDSPYFNPRSREGSDYNSRYCYCVANISIHAPAKGATNRAVDMCRNIIISIHAPAKGATVPHLSEHYRIAISIHAPAKGATQYNTREMSRLIISIHAPAKGATM